MMAWLGRAVTSAALVGLCAAADDGDPPMLSRGAADYYTKFKAISSPAGKFEPTYNPDTFEYTLTVQEVELDELTIQMALENSRYAPGQEPEIQVDGKDLKFNPFDGIQIKVPLNETIGALRKKVSVRIFDPNNMEGAHLGNFGQLGNSHTYTITVLQGPEMDKITKATGVVVKDMQGAAMDYAEGSPKLNPKTDERTFTFLVTKDRTHMLNITLKCPNEEGTSVMFEGMTYKVGTPVAVDVSKHFTTTTQFACQYQDAMWSKSVDSTTYTLIFEELVTKPAFVLGRLDLVPNYGFCEELNWTPKSKQGSERFKGWKGDIAKANKGFVCRADSSRSHAVAFLADPRVYAELIEESTGESTKLTGGVKAEIHTPKEGLFTLRVIAGNLKADYPVLMFQPQHCDTWMPLPNLVHTIRDPILARSWLCREKECDIDVDKKTCLTNGLPCTSFKGVCPAHQKLRGADHACSFADHCDSVKDVQKCCFQPEMRGAQVDFHGTPAVVLGMRDHGGHQVVDLVVESTTGLARDVSIDSVSQKEVPTFEVAEHVVRNGQKGVVKEADKGKYVVAFIHPASEEMIEGDKVMELRKDVDWWQQRKQGQAYDGQLECLESPRLSYLVLLGDKVVTLTGDEAKGMKRVPYFSAGQKVQVQGKNGTILKDCGGQFGKCSGSLADGGTFGPVKDSDFAQVHVKATMPLKPTTFKPGEIVYIDKSVRAKVEECGESDCRLTKLSDGSKSRVPTGLIAKEVALNKTDKVWVGGKQGQIVDDCNNMIKCHVKFDDGSESKDISAVLLIANEEEFTVDEVVMVHDRRGTISESNCGGVAICVVHMEDVDAPMRDVSPQTITRQEPFRKGEEVIADFRRGKIAELCDTRIGCKVDYGNGVTKDKVKTKDIRRVAHMMQGQEVQVDGRVAVVVSACERHELCELRFLDGKEPFDTQRAYSEVLETNNWLPGAEFTLDGKKGVVLERVSSANFIATLAHNSASSESGAKETIVKIVKEHQMSKGVKLGWVAAHNDTEGGSPSRVNDPFVPLLRVNGGEIVSVGDRVMSGDRVAIVSDILGKDQFVLVYQDDGTESSPMARSAFSLKAAERLVGDRVIVKGQLGTVTEVLPVDPKAADKDAMYRVTMDADNTTTPPLKAESCPLKRQWFDIGDEVVSGGHRARIETVEVLLGAYTLAFWRDQSLYRGPTKSWQLTTSASFYGRNKNLAAGDEVLVLGGEPGVVLGGPDSEGDFKVSTFTSFQTEVRVPGMYLTKTINTNEVSSYQCQVDDKVKCTGGENLGKTGQVVGLSMGFCNVKFDGVGQQAQPIDAKDLECVAQTLVVGKVVYPKGEAAEVLYGPDNFGRYVVSFLDSGLTDGPYSFCDLPSTAPANAPGVAVKVGKSGFAPSSWMTPAWGGAVGGMFLGAFAAASALLAVASVARTWGRRGDSRLSAAGEGDRSQQFLLGSTED